MLDDDTISRIEAALEAGPTPGPWHHEEWGSRIVDSGVGSSQLLIAQVAVNTFMDQGRHNANFIAACNPVAIRTLLDRLKTAESECERLRGLYEDKAAELCNLQIAFSDWKVFHSTMRLEVELARLRTALRPAMDALLASVDIVEHEYITDWRHGMPTRKAQLDAKAEGVAAHKEAIELISVALEDTDA